MKKVNVKDAVGLPLCHDITALRGDFRGPAFRRGHVVTEADIPALLDLGKRTVYVWEEQAGEIHEEDAARRLAALSEVTGAAYSGPSEGKMTLTARTRGMFRVDTDLLREVNEIPDVTVTTLPDHYPAEPGTRLAAMRIVPLVTREERIVRAEELCRRAAEAGRKLLDLRPYRPRKAGIIITGSEVYHRRIQDRFEPVIRKKLENYPSEIVGVTICDDDVEMIVSAAREHLAKGADLLIFTGGMSVDPDDVTPTAVRALGAEVVRYGVPSQPGNMTLAAYLNGGTGMGKTSERPDTEETSGKPDGTEYPHETAILGVPGAAVVRPVTVMDALLPQIFAGDRLTEADLIRLGDGGLCQLCTACHFPNCTFGRY